MIPHRGYVPRITAGLWHTVGSKIKRLARPALTSLCGPQLPSFPQAGGASQGGWRLVRGACAAQSPNRLDSASKQPASALSWSLLQRGLAGSRSGEHVPMFFSWAFLVFTASLVVGFSGGIQKATPCEGASRLYPLWRFLHLC